MKKKLTLVAILAAGVMASPAFAFGLPKVGNLTGSAAAPAPTGSAVDQDQLVQSYVKADSEVLNAQSKMALALGLKDQAASAQAAAEAYSQGATLDAVKKSSSVQSDNSEAIKDAQAADATLTDESKSQFADGLKHLASGLVQTIALKSSAQAFGEQAKQQVASASLLEKASVTSKLASGTYVATNLPGHIVSLGSTLKSAVNFAQNHQIPVPSDATAALSALN